MPESPKLELKKPKNYYYGTGRRKTAIAKVRIYLGKGKFTINDVEKNDLVKSMLQPFIVTGQINKFDASIKVSGGGIISQQGAISLGIARALVAFDENLRSVLRKSGLLTRDSREKERKKPGLKRARKAPQWQKR